MNKFDKYYNELMLKESPPLPDDWDKEIYSDKTSFAKQVKYAMERAKKLGTGSSRVVFTIEYDGRPTALKIAKNKKGLAQNRTEADYGLYQMHPDITIPLIDYDEISEEPRWIHTEKAEKMRESDFKRITGLDFKTFGLALKQWDYEVKRIGWVNYNIDPKPLEKIQESEIYQSVIELMSNFNILSGDLTRTANWGLYQGRPVIIDLGFSSEIKRMYYS